ELLDSGVKLTTAETAIGTGAFIFNKLEPAVSSEYVRNPNYWNAGLPYLDKVQELNSADDQASYAAFQSGQMDMATVPGDQVKDYIAKQGAGFRPLYDGRGTLNHAMWPNLKRAPFNDQRVSMALRLLPDYRQVKALLET